MKTFICTFLILIVGLFCIWKDVDTDPNTKYKCTYISKEMCVIESSAKEVEKADISHLDHSKFEAGQEVVYDEKTPKQLAVIYTVDLIFVCILFFIICRIFAACGFRGFDISDVCNAID